MEKCPSCGKKKMFTNSKGLSKCYGCGFKQDVIKEEAELKAIKKEVVKKDDRTEEYDEEIKDLKKKISNIDRGDKMVEKEKEEVWSLQKVPIEYGLAIINSETEEAFDVMSALTKLLNDMEYLKKVLR